MAHTHCLWFFTDQITPLLILAGVGIAYHLYAGYTMPFDVTLRTLAVVSSLPLCLKPANILIKNILDVFQIQAPEGIQPFTIHPQYRMKILINSSIFLSLAT